MGRVLQIVGYQNSGKTTFVTEYIKEAESQGLKVGTIKHHGHSSKIDFGDKYKDTGKHRQAGAYISTVEANGSFIISSEKLSLTLQQMISIYLQFDLDLILVEAFKRESYPKVVLIRTVDDLPMLKTLTNIICIIADIPQFREIEKKYKTFKETDQAINWLLKNRVGENIE